MAVGRFASSQALATRLILKNGEKVSFVRVTDAVDPLQTNRVTGKSTSTTTVDAVFFDITLARIEGQLGKTRTATIWIPAEGLGTTGPDPTTDHVIRVDGSRWKFTGPGETIQPNEDLIVHQLSAREE